MTTPPCVLAHDMSYRRKCGGRQLLNRSLHARAGLTGVSGLSLIDPDHEMLEGNEKQFHMATVSTSLQARLRLPALMVLCSFTLALPACTQAQPHTTVPCNFRMVWKGEEGSRCAADGR